MYLSHPNDSSFHLFAVLLATVWFSILSFLSPSPCPGCGRGSSGRRMDHPLLSWIMKRTIKGLHLRCDEAAS